MLLRPRIPSLRGCARRLGTPAIPPSKTCNHPGVLPLPVTLHSMTTSRGWWRPAVPSRRTAVGEEKRERTKGRGQSPSARPHCASDGTRQPLLLPGGSNHAGGEVTAGRLSGSPAAGGTATAVLPEIKPKLGPCKPWRTCCRRAHQPR